MEDHDIEHSAGAVVAASTFAVSAAVADAAASVLAAVARVAVE